MPRNNANSGNGSSRDRRSRTKPLSVATQAANIAHHSGQISAPLTSARSQLLAGLRTAPCQPQGMQQQQQQQAHHAAVYVSQPQNMAEYYAAIASQNSQYYHPMQMQMQTGHVDYAQPELDPEYAAQLQATEAFLLQRQQLLQNQLLQLSGQQYSNQMREHQYLEYQKQQQQQQQQKQQQQQQQQFQLQILQQQLEQMQLVQQHQQQQQQQHQQQYSNYPQNSMYAQQLQNGVSPVPQEVPGQPGLYIVHNPLTNQQIYAYDPVIQQQMGTVPPPNALPLGTGLLSPPITSGSGTGSPPSDGPQHGTTSRSDSPGKTTHSGYGSSSAPSRRVQSPPNGQRSNQRHVSRPSQPSTRESSPPVQRQQKLNPANANKSSNSKASSTSEPKGKFLVPIRQPYTPPPIQEIRAAPDSSFADSKNFAVMRRGEALKRLVSAGINRRAGNTVSTPTVTVADYGSGNESDSDSTAAGFSSSKMGAPYGSFGVPTQMVLIPGGEVP